jgi:CubicO group peptidase (beta-lactamase class C family)
VAAGVSLCGVALVLRGTSVLNEVVGGIADRETGALCTRQTRFQVASVSKQFTAAAILLLVQRGRLRLDDPVERWLPGCPASWQYMTVHHLLTHTSGIGHWDAIPLFDPLRPADPGDLVPMIQQSTLRAAPGRAWFYSSPGYILLGQIVQAASGDTYAAFLSEHVLTPLGLSATSAGAAPADGPVARGYRDGQPVRPWEMSFQAGTGNIWSTAADLTRFAAAVGSAELLTTDSRRAMFAIQAPIEPEITTGTGWEPHGYGYGWFIGVVAGHPGYYHPGDNPGYQSFNARLHDPAIRLAVVTNDETTDLRTVVADLVGRECGGR